MDIEDKTERTKITTVNSISEKPASKGCKLFLLTVIIESSIGDSLT